MNKQRITIISIVLLTVALVAGLAIAQSTGDPRLRLSAEDSDLLMGQEVVVDVLVENAPVIYGADVRLAFDPNLLEVVDTDESQDGVQPAHGDFLDPAQSFILQHQADNGTGAIDYALALLNPAPPVQGDGLLAQVTFRATAEGQTTISIEDGLFGNQAGETIAPLLDSIEISIGTNQPPTANAGGPYSVDEGGSVTVTATGSDPEGGPLDFAWDLDDDGTFETPGQSVIFSTAVLDGPDSRTLTVQVADIGGLSATAPATVNVLNLAPMVGEIAAPLNPLQVNTTITASATFTDAGVLDTHTAVWDWDDGDTSPGVVEETGGSGTVTGSHTYTTAGVYTVRLTVTDDDGDSDESIFRNVVVYDPEGGFVTGGGWIQLPEGAYIPDPSLTGKANFGFVSKYKKGSHVPTGQTQFQFKVADLKFHSDTYDWLVVAGARARYKGTGTINGEGEYKFMLTGVDADVNPNDNIEVDRFRIKIWVEDEDGNETIVYDNGLDADDNPDDPTVGTTEIGGGSIVIHKQK